jgi:hypothetical protein
MHQLNVTCGSHVTESYGVNLLFNYFVSGFKAETAGIFHCDVYARDSGIASKIANNCIIKNKIITIISKLFI